MISRGFIKNSLVYTLAGTLPMASATILLPFYIHYLSTESFGVLFIYFAFSWLVQIIATFSFDSSIYVYYHEYKKDKHKLSIFISTAFLQVLLIGLALALLLLIIGSYVFQLVFKNPLISFYPLGLMTVFTAIFQAIFKVFNSLLQTRQKPERFLYSNLLSFSLIAGLTILGLQIYPNSLIGPIGGRLLAAFISGGWALFNVLGEFGFHFNYPLLRSTLSFNFYTFIYQFQQWLMNYFDRILVSFFLPLSEVGIYGFTMSFMIVIEFIVNGINSSFTPKVVGMIVDQPEKKSTPEINRYYYGLTAVTMIMVSFCILVFPVLIEHFVKKKEYQLAIQYIPYVALIYLYRGTRAYFGIPYGILKYTKPLPLIYLFVASIKIVGLILLIKYVGIYGVIAASLMSYLSEIILLYQVGKDKFGFKFNTFKLVGAPTALLITIASMELLIDNAYSNYLHLFYFVMCLGLLAFAFRKETKLIIPFKI